MPMSAGFPIRIARDRAPPDADTFFEDLIVDAVASAVTEYTITPPPGVELTAIKRLDSWTATSSLPTPAMAFPLNSPSWPSTGLAIAHLGLVDALTEAVTGQPSPYQSVPTEDQPPFGEAECAAVGPWMEASLRGVLAALPAGTDAIEVGPSGDGDIPRLDDDGNVHRDIVIFRLYVDCGGRGGRLDLLLPPEAVGLEPDLPYGHRDADMGNWLLDCFEKPVDFLETLKGEHPQVAAAAIRVLPRWDRRQLLDWLPLDVERRVRDARPSPVIGFIAHSLRRVVLDGVPRDAVRGLEDDTLVPNEVERYGTWTPVATFAAEPLADGLADRLGEYCGGRATVRLTGTAQATIADMAALLKSGEAAFLLEAEDWPHPGVLAFDRALASAVIDRCAGGSGAVAPVPEDRPLTFVERRLLFTVTFMSAYDIVLAMPPTTRGIVVTPSGWHGAERLDGWDATVTVTLATYAVDMDGGPGTLRLYLPEAALGTEKTVGSAAMLDRVTGKSAKP